MTQRFKRLPESELMIMLIIWKTDRAITRAEIEDFLDGTKKLAPTTILSFLSRLEEKGYVEVKKIGKTNYYSALIGEEEYRQKEGRNLLKRFYDNSIRNFVAAMYDGESVSKQELEELQKFIDEHK